jgi:hypothetical protein
MPHHFATASAGTFVEPRGMIRSAVASAAGGLVGAVAATATTGPLRKGEIGYLGVFPGEVVLFAAKRGAFKPKPTTNVIATAPRSSVRSAQIDKGRIAGLLDITFADGTAWQFEIPRVHLGGANQVVSVLGHPAT